MSDFRFGDDYKLNVYPHIDYHNNDDWSFDDCERVEIDGVDFIRERTCTFKVEHARNGWLDWRCSNCNEVIANTDIHVILDFNYCPNCGAEKIVENDNL